MILISGEAFDVVFDVTKRIAQESESEQGDKTYLVRTDLVGQVLLSMMTLLKRQKSGQVKVGTDEVVQGGANVRNGDDGGLAVHLDSAVGVGRHGRVALQVASTGSPTNCFWDTCQKFAGKQIRC